MTYTPRFTEIYVDIDGVLADFFGGVCDLVGVQARPPTTFDGLADAFGLSNNALWAQIDGAGSRFWSELKPYGWNEELLGICRNIATRGVYIASSPSWHGSSAAGKIEWMTKQFAAPGEHYREFMIGPHKHLLAHPWAILIDDSPAKIAAWDESGGLGLLWPQPWNTQGDVVGARDQCLSDLRKYA